MICYAAVVRNWRINRGEVVGAAVLESMTRKKHDCRFDLPSGARKAGQYLPHLDMTEIETQPDNETKLLECLGNIAGVIAGVGQRSKRGKIGRIANDESNAIGPLRGGDQLRLST